MSAIADEVRWTEEIVSVIGKRWKANEGGLLVKQTAKGSTSRDARNPSCAITSWKNDGA